MATVLTLTANTLLDGLATGPALRGRVNRVDRFNWVAGGKGINVGRVLARFGHRVVAAGFAGGWSGAELTSIVAADGMEPLLVETHARTRIGFQLDGASDPIAFVENGFAVTPDELSRLVSCVRTRLGEVDLVLISGSVPDPSCESLYVEVLGACARCSVPCWIDSYGPALARALACNDMPALAKANREEFGSGHGWDRCPETHLTDGPRDIRVRISTTRWIVRPPLVSEKSAIGSGDCYFAALAHGRLTGLADEVALKWAAAAGAANAALGAAAHVGPDDIAPWVDSVLVIPEGTIPHLS
jgi:fructose-1-phosphate kinase PfkB-like protein